MSGLYAARRSSSGSDFAGVRRFLSWWKNELLALIPPALRPLPRSQKRFFWVRFAADQATVLHFSGDQLREIGRIDLAKAVDPSNRKLAFNALLTGHGTKRLGLVLPPEQMLKRHIELPIAARDNLRQVLGYELGRHTPFSADHAWFDYREKRLDAARGQIELELLVAAKRPIEESLQHLREWGREIEVVAPLDELGTTPRYANLLPPGLRPGIGWQRKAAYFLLLCVPVLLLAVALMLPLWQKREQAVALNTEVQMAKKRAAVIDGLRIELDQVGLEYRYLLEKKYRQPAAIEVMEEVTRLLPDDVWLTQLDIKGDEVLLSGEMASSMPLIRQLEKSSLMQDASFRAPLVKGRNNAVRFSVAAKLTEGDLAGVLARQPENDAALVVKPLGSNVKGGG